MDRFRLFGEDSISMTKWKRHARIGTRKRGSCLIGCGSLNWMRRKATSSCWGKRRGATGEPKGGSVVSENEPGEDEEGRVIELCSWLFVIRKMTMRYVYYRHSPRQRRIISNKNLDKKTTHSHQVLWRNSHIRIGVIRQPRTGSSWSSHQSSCIGRNMYTAFYDTVITHLWVRNHSYGQQASSGCMSDSHSWPRRVGEWNTVTTNST